MDFRKYIETGTRDNVVLVPTLKASYDIVENADIFSSHVVRNMLQILNNARRVISNMIKNKVI